MAEHETQVPETRSSHNLLPTASRPSATLALNCGNRCRCGIRPDRETALEHHETVTTRKRPTTTAPNRGNHCRCGIRPDWETALEHREDGAARKCHTTIRRRRPDKKEEAGYYPYQEPSGRGGCCDFRSPYLHFREVFREFAEICDMEKSEAW